MHVQRGQHSAGLHRGRNRIVEKIQEQSLTWLLELTLTRVASAELQPFDTDAFEAIAARHASEPVLPLLWSLDWHHRKDGMVRAGGCSA